MRTFDTGAIRDDDHGKIDPEGALSPYALERFCRYMLEHNVQADGEYRSSDNWQRGIPLDAYMKSMWRHFLHVWTLHRDGHMYGPDMEDALCALLFNVQGYLHEIVER